MTKYECNFCYTKVESPVQRELNCPVCSRRLWKVMEKVSA